MESFSQCFSDQVNLLTYEKNPQKAENLLKELKNNLKTKEFKIELLNNFEFWFSTCCSLNEQILKNFPMVYINLEKNLLLWLCDTSFTISNFSLFLLSDLLQLLPRIRVIQISDYLIKSLKQSTEPRESIYRFLSLKDSVSHSIQQLVKSKSFDLAQKVSFYMHPNAEVFEFIKSSLSLEGAFELHYILARSANQENLSSYLKNCASRVWALNNTGSKKKVEVMALVEYCSCKFLRNELKSIDVLKSVIVTLTAVAEYLATADDFNVASKVKKLLPVLDCAGIQESHRKKIKEVADRIRDKLIASEEIMKSFDVSDIESGRGSKTPCLAGPINEIAMILGLTVPACGESSESAISALENITHHLKTTCNQFTADD